MSNITINEEESQAQNQKTTPVMEPSSEPNNSNTNLLDSLFLTWLGWRDSNPRMHGPKPCALPLGDTPIYRKICTMNYSTIGVGLLSLACVSVYNRE